MTRTLEAVLRHLLTDRESPLAARKQPSKQFRLLNQYERSRLGSGLLDELVKKLSPGTDERVREAAADLERRATGKEKPALVPPKVPGVRMMAPQERGKPGSDRPVSAFPSGYTPDRRHAVVGLIIPWSIHHAEGLYLLERTESGWNVIGRGFTYYP
jgi:hypothetical protein